MDRNKAERALKAIETKYAKWIKFSKDDGVSDPDCYPKLVENYHGGMDKPVPFAVVWEVNSPDEWAIKWGSAKREDPRGIFMEAIYSFVLGVYDDV